MRQHKLLWSSSYDRGLMPLLKMWPTIRRKFPDASLEVCYGWDLFLKVAAGNAERMGWKEKVDELLTQPGVTHHGRIGKAELKQLQQECGILAYCSDFTEIFCISAFEAQLNGCVPVTTDIAALGEFTTGRVVVKGDIYDNEVKEEYLNQLLLLMGDRERWQQLQNEGRSFAEQFTWDKVAKRWTELFGEQKQDVKVSIMTPTIRKGFWNIMANNIANQGYKNVEWIIVDDFPEDREYLAKLYAKRYSIEIKYLRGKKRAVKRRYGLVNANNTGWQNATGELVVILQDFVLMPEDGLEQLVNLHRKNPNALLAPCDQYFKPKIKPDIMNEDWFHKELDVVGDFIWQNPRIQNGGIRESVNPFEFEQNYGAIPKHILDALGGWWEFLDFGLGYDNTIIGLMALMAGYKLIVDETNLAQCIDHWAALKGTDGNDMERGRRLNDPLFLWAKTMLESGKLPLKRTQEIDNQIDLQYEIPENIPSDNIPQYIRENMDKIIQPWLKKYEKGFV